MRTDATLERQERLRERGKVELPLNIDTRKYLYGNISFYDLLIVLPFLLLGALVAYLLLKAGYLNQHLLLIAFTPAMIVAVLQLNKHPVRKNLSLLQYKVIWKLKANARRKEFHYAKGALPAGKEEPDTRTELGLANIANGCMETTDNRIIKVLEISSVNLSLMNDLAKENVLEAYQSFINDMGEKQIQLMQVAQPINLTNYLMWFNEQVGQNSSYAKRVLKQGYASQIEQVQRSKNMVTRKRYLVISKPINRSANGYMQLETTANILKAKLEQMLSGYEKLDVNILDNDELLKFYYACLDFESAQAQGENITNKTNAKLDVVVGKNTAKALVEEYRQLLNDRFE
ncbi:TrsD [Planococcus lenghuensis]|uniref:TrsD n=1 Tax=Planococcus lenghuensis TaxID=2213202 RepID=A0A1Q2L671_9BACL|nr:TrsD [Planococcus lenghuensis]AQQ55587.1 TrsD [Planococcus lenghuensis]